MNLDDRILIITKIAQENPKIGKTALMKYLYFLQEIEKVPLKYTFEIYTYGPYSSTVMDEIDYASQKGFLNISFEQYGYGYSISCSSDGEAALEDANIIREYDSAISRIITTFSGKTAKELELLSTLVYIAQLYQINRWELTEENVCSSVKEVKPHFELDYIKQRYQFLSSGNYLDKALQLQ